MGNHRILFNFTHEGCLAEPELREISGEGEGREVGREARRGGFDKGVKSGVSWDSGPLLVKPQEVGPFSLSAHHFLRMSTRLPANRNREPVPEGSLQPLSPLCRDTGQKLMPLGSSLSQD